VALWVVGGKGRGNKKKKKKDVLLFPHRGKVRLSNKILVGLYVEHKHAKRLSSGHEDILWTYKQQKKGLWDGQSKTPARKMGKKGREMYGNTQGGQGIEGCATDAYCSRFFFWGGGVVGAGGTKSGGCDCFAVVRNLWKEVSTEWRIGARETGRLAKRRGKITVKKTQKREVSPGGDGVHTVGSRRRGEKIRGGIVKAD